MPPIRFDRFRTLTIRGEGIPEVSEGEGNGSVIGADYRARNADEPNHNAKRREGKNTAGTGGEGRGGHGGPVLNTEYTGTEGGFSLSSGTGGIPISARVREKIVVWCAKQS
jgi:hypothetical protein